jgi:hypothetical protein
MTTAAMPHGWRESDCWSMEGLAEFIEKVMDNPWCIRCGDEVRGPVTSYAIFRGTMVDY